MNPRLYPAALVAVFTALCTQAADQAMEHVEVIGYPAPKIEERVSDNNAHTAQLAEQYRQELLQLLRQSQRKQLQALHFEEVASNKEILAEETSAEQQKQQDPAGLENEPVKLEQKASEMPPAQKSEDEHALQESS